MITQVWISRIHFDDCLDWTEEQITVSPKIIYVRCRSFCQEHLNSIRSYWTSRNDMRYLR